ncbi:MULTISPECIES: fumarylacetoacetate hydrolase family protein [unclassified Haladaptatus]|uniref:fumarylacetoacetate hydrolase family protein n=1 Tax=unclassified Haladaptatus TaxID=2622732 RepID=UPI0023E8AFCA|nr:MULTISPECIES: fumarylacetoacetate hydrolase family protein [unclassified Haladaptatus]
MRYYLLPTASGERLIAETPDGAYDLTAAKRTLTSFSQLAESADLAETSVDAIASGLIDSAPEVSKDRLDDEATLPLRPDEVWAAGVTYQISEQARENESGMPEMYLDVYQNERPEIFFKATPNRTVGPGEAIGIRADSDWDVPEPELGIVLYDGEIVGYTIGNDVSSRSIEGSNPLYLPQAKVYDRCCAVGPCVATADSIGDPHELEMSMSITRDSETVFDGTTSTSEMVRDCEELVSYYRRHNHVPKLAVLLTGTSLVPDDDFTLAEGDVVRISIENVGSIENTVITV